MNIAIVREVVGSITRLSNRTQWQQRLATAAMFLQSYAAPAPSRFDPQRVV